MPIGRLNSDYWNLNGHLVLKNSLKLVKNNILKSIGNQHRFKFQPKLFEGF